MSLAARYPDVSLFHTRLPFKRNNAVMRRYMVNRFGTENSWVLCVDVDEFFDFPYSDRISLKAFLRYLNMNHYTAVLGYMLDRFSDRPLAEAGNTAPGSLHEAYPYYDITSIRKSDYFIFKDPHTGSEAAPA